MLGIFLLELLDAAGRVDQFLLAGKKRMTGGTDLDLHLGEHGTELNFIAAGACCLDLMVFRMDIGFHCRLMPPKNVHTGTKKDPFQTGN